MNSSLFLGWCVKWLKPNFPGRFIVHFFRDYYVKCNLFNGNRYYMNIAAAIFGPYFKIVAGSRNGINIKNATTDIADKIDGLFWL